MTWVGIKRPLSKYVVGWVSVAVAVSAAAGPIESQEKDEKRGDEINFQTHALWSPRLNIEAGTAIVYGIDPSLAKRVESWRSHGYHVALMTGVSWGEYSDYLDGRFDGKKHWDEAQVESSGQQILHGQNRSIPYIAPSASYGKYLASGVLRGLDAGVEGVYLEEPEFWAKSGWSESFKREWVSSYGTPWQAPDSSPDAQYRASKLKYLLYRRALADVFDAVRKYGEEHHRKIPCYVATHSLLNYAQWRIVSPESSLIDVGADGYIAQVWTGTARTPNAYDGKVQERTFETAFLEYGAMQNLVRASGRRVWYLNDPIEDNPNHAWRDYRTNWESTLTASLLQPAVTSYEIVPWPERIFGPRAAYPSDESPEKRVSIPAAYETELQVVFHALGQMKQAGTATRWEAAGSQGIGVLVSDTLMFQRANPSPSDARLSSFYGLALPLLSHGIPVEPVQMESFDHAKIAERYRCLVLTYEGQKPPSVAFHHALVNWVKAGGVLVVVDDDKDIYRTVSEWWNTGPSHHTMPREELFKELGLSGEVAGVTSVGKGFVYRKNTSPASLAMRPDGSKTVLAAIRTAMAARAIPLLESDRLVLRRGPYVVAAGLSNVGSSVPQKSTGYYLDLFSPDLSILRTDTVRGGERRLLLDVSAITTQAPSVIASASHIREEQSEQNRLTFLADGIEGSSSVVRIKARGSIARVTLDNTPLETNQFGSDGVTAWIRFENHAMPRKLEVEFTN
jgi:hypothetical protein